MSNPQATRYSSNKPSPGTNIGVRIGRTNLSPGTTRLNSGSVTLTPPSRVGVLGKPSSERYQSAYSRLGGLRNSSAPNISALVGDKSGTGNQTVSGLTSNTSNVARRLNLGYRGRLGQSTVGKETSEIEDNGQKPTSFAVAQRIGKSVGRAESLKEEYLSFTVHQEGKSNSLTDMREPGRRYQPSVSVTPRTIELPKSFSPRPVIGLGIPSKDEVIKREKDVTDNYVFNSNHGTETKNRDIQVTKLTEKRQSQERKVGSRQLTKHIPDVALTDTTKSEEVSTYTRSLPEHTSPSAESARVPSSTVPAPVHDLSDRKFPPVKDTDSPSVRDMFYTGVGGTDNSTDIRDSTSEAEIRSTPTSDTTPVAMPRSKRKPSKRSISFKRVEEDEYIGFSSLPEQVHRKAVRRGFEFTLMVVGETGLGKSTLINSLFLTDLYKDRKVENTEERVHKTVDLEKKELEIEERGVKLKLTIVDTPGFNDAVNAEESWKPIVNYIDKQFETYFQAESGLNRKNIQDTRVHCCLYFISPYGHGLRPVDVSVMKKLHHKVNIVPLIAKADMLTKKEMKRLKEKVLQEVEKHKINIYQFPDCDSDEDEEFKQQDTDLKKAIPFAVVGSNTVVEAGGKKIRGRMYPWGIVEVENPQHCDFVKLRQMLISTHMQDLKDVTCDNHYENYRAEHIAEQMTTHQKERNKLKRDSTPNLDKALDTERLLQEKEMEIKRMQEMLAKMQAQLHNKGGPQMNGKIGNV